MLQPWHRPMEWGDKHDMWPQWTWGGRWCRAQFVVIAVSHPSWPHHHHRHCHHHNHRHHHYHALRQMKYCRATQVEACCLEDSIMCTLKNVPSMDRLNVQLFLNGVNSLRPCVSQGRAFSQHLHDEKYVTIDKKHVMIDQALQIIQWNCDCFFKSLNWWLLQLSNRW